MSNYEELRKSINGYQAFRKDGKWGFIDQNGTEIIPNIYESVTDFQDTTQIAKAISETEVAYIKADGQILKQYDKSQYELSPFQYGYGIVTKNGKEQFVMDGNGTEVLKENENTIIEVVGQNVFLIQKGNYFGLMDDKKNMIIEPKYEQLKYINDNVILYQENGKYGVMNREKEIIAQPTYDYLTVEQIENDPNHNYVKYVSNLEVGVIAEQGTKPIKFDFSMDDPMANMIQIRILNDSFIVSSISPTKVGLELYTKEGNRILKWEDNEIPYSIREKEQVIDVYRYDSKKTKWLYQYYNQSGQLEQETVPRIEK